MWEYKVIKVKTGGHVVPNLDEVTSDVLNEYGKEGWELITVVTMHKGGGQEEQAYYYFKRPRA